MSVLQQPSELADSLGTEYFPQAALLHYNRQTRQWDTSQHPSCVMLSFIMGLVDRVGCSSTETVKNYCDLDFPKESAVLLAYAMSVNLVEPASVPVQTCAPVSGLCQ